MDKEKSLEVLLINQWVTYCAQNDIYYQKPFNLLTIGWWQLFLLYATPLILTPNIEIVVWNNCDINNFFFLTIMILQILESLDFELAQAKVVNSYNALETHSVTASKGYVWR